MKHLHLLVVDDEKRFVDNLAKRLILRGLSVTTAYRGETALNLLEQNEFPVMVLDLRLPDIDGVEILQRVGREFPGTHVIILTGHGSEQDFQTCNELGAFAFLNKPVDIDNLLAIIKQAGENDLD